LYFVVGIVFCAFSYTTSAVAQNKTAMRFVLLKIKYIGEVILNMWIKSIYLYQFGFYKIKNTQFKF
jgi:hypothetical protein